MINNPAINSPLGDIWIEAGEGAITTLSWQPLPEPANQADRLIWHQAVKWLFNYFQSAKAGQPPSPPTFLLRPKGSPFQQSVWDYLLKIPPGKTVTYGDVAKAINSAPRAVGQAVGTNPIPIIIPCHRVVAANGLGGYSGFGGVESKKKLLHLESLLETKI
jgi:methylated-DNA-[protein]-cysteine S-methyltransferase